jgi:hypothetical protein
MDSLAPLSGLSVLSEPAYVDTYLSKEFDLINRISEFSVAQYDFQKISIDETYTRPMDTEASDEPCSIGRLLRAEAALHLAPPYRTAQWFVGEPQQKTCRKRHTKRHAVLLIATQLSELQSEDPEKIVIVKKINRLGFDSPGVLTKHFGQFGRVEKVLLSNAHSKTPDFSPKVRLRPSGIGFLVFESPEVAARVVAEGQTQMINGFEVIVRAFERRQFDSSSPVADENDDETSSIETTSTRCSSGSCGSFEEE